MYGFISKLMYPTYFKRYAFFFISDIIVISASLYLAFLLRFDLNLLEAQKALIYGVLPLFITIKLAVFTTFNLCRVTWKYVGLKDLVNMTGAIIVSESLLVLFVYLPTPGDGLLSMLSVDGVRFYGFPRSVFIIDAANTLILLFLLRISKRLYLEVLKKNGATGGGMRTIVVGAGNAGEMIIRDMSRQGFAGFNPIGLLDDDKNKTGTYMHGVKVLGAIDTLRPMVLRKGIEAVIIAIPSLNQKVLRAIYTVATEAGVKTIKIVPRIYDFTSPEVNLKNLESIRIEDLIGRQSVEVDYASINEFLKGKNILITGAGGSIGSEITVQVLSSAPGRVALLDIDETELHNMEMRLKRMFPRHFSKDASRGAEKVSFIVADIRDSQRLNEVFDAVRPDIVFHAAAYKHVPMMEHNPTEAVKVNIFGAHAVALAAVSSGARKFVMISTDKAVMPTSVMGATKRMSENVCRAMNCAGGTEFVSVRFGNVLGSRGSVLPLFMEQLKNGGPLTVTHREMKRYFMTIPEAVSLVLQASVIGRGGEVLVLDMGEPVRIVDLAEELIRINGLVPHKDIDIEFIDPRPGEKLFEEILTAEEGTTASLHRQIFVAKNSDRFTVEEIRIILGEFDALIHARPKPEAVKDLLKKYVRHFEEPRLETAAVAPRETRKDERPSVMVQEKEALA
ncbi:MAG: UDP-N-acetylglucosamine 4,6-dehydratase [Deltaproteobacteria bacterium GWB2_55_19]|nr:MAG: UDP-N-acetylglucosamine 4,6-dehydratase [Deltaproteobacteria bacterium GWB2_55_19]HAO92834.1 polysaccharide biosynthesis protein [Deltaproteobacteria bacterium]